MAGKTEPLDHALTPVDGKTADFFHFEMEFLGRVANRIVNEVRGINRVVYGVTFKSPAPSSGSESYRIDPMLPHLILPLPRPRRRR